MINNGHISNFFDIKRGLRQGCPLSPYLFILVVELLAMSIRENNKIVGYKMSGKVCKVNQYADDMFVSIKNERESILEVFKEIDKFGNISGLKLNIDKTELMVFGDEIKNSDLVQPEWVKEEINLLGIKLSKEPEKLISKNFDDKVQKVKDCLLIWGRRNLSLLGRIHVLKSLTGSQFIYNWFNLPSPSPEFFKTINKLFYKFL